MYIACEINKTERTERNKKQMEQKNAQTHTQYIQSDRQSERCREKKPKPIIFQLLTVIVFSICAQFN